MKPNSINLLSLSEYGITTKKNRKQEKKIIVPNDNTSTILTGSTKHSKLDNYGEETNYTNQLRKVQREVQTRRNSFQLLSNRIKLLKKEDGRIKKKIEAVHKRAESLVLTQKSAEQKFMKRLELNTMADKMSNLRYDQTQKKRQQLNQVKGIHRQNIRNSNSLIGDQIREMLREGRKQK
mmetsp:Transcript_481/g.467  ORF Transcript_481/g.467 Transcript_481/m.467 type:complete len:179 (-) Transcript_481:378-914(-)